jgi:CRISPR-associated protein Cas2
MRSTYLICYDVTDDKRRDQVFKVCKNHGTHVQFSVFECDLNAMELTGLQRELLAVISSDDDQVLVVDLGPVEGRGDRVISALGRPYSKMDAPCYVV